MSRKQDYGEGGRKRGRGGKQEMEEMKMRR